MVKLRESTPEKYMQVFFDANFEFIPYLNPTRISRTKNSKLDSIGRDSLYSTDIFVEYITEILQDTKNINPESPLHTGSYSSELILSDYYLSSSPSLRSILNLPEDYFASLILQYAEKTKDEYTKVAMYHYVASHWIRTHNKKQDGINLFYEIKDKFPKSRIVKEGVVDRYLRKQKLNPKNVESLVEAPSFAIIAISGDSLHLKDYKGQFVYLDFWSTSCGPCRKEIANVNKLYEANIVQVIGIANDKPEILKNFMSKNKLNYPNAIATDNILNNYGITGYPTTFLISPDGKIIAHRLRGENLVDQVQEKVVAWQKSLN
jgi:peroxiredoxin